jgi:methylated-DNA-[protein]-cysteine S-methyltransferase
MTFTEKVLKTVSSIPKGKVMTYKQVATKAGNPKASRAVGNIMRNNYNTQVPCHRVVLSSGIIGDYNRGGQDKKTALLKSEGVKFINKYGKETAYLGSK